MATLRRFAAAAALTCLLAPTLALAQSGPIDRRMKSELPRNANPPNIAQPYERGRPAANHFESSDARVQRCASMTDRAERDSCESRLRSQGVRIAPGSLPQ